MRLGAMKRPFYRLVAVDSRNRRDGRYIENLGTYNPLPKNAELVFKEDRILHWLGEGAQLSKTAEDLIRTTGLLERHQLMKSGVAGEELESKLAELKARQPQRSADTRSRAEKKAQKKEAAAAKAEAAKAEAAKAEASADADGAAEAEPSASEGAEA
jgi:small subunit ribosomal protein S16